MDRAERIGWGIAFVVVYDTGDPEAFPPNTKGIGVPSGYSLCDGAWHHIVGTWAPDVGTSLYVDRNYIGSLKHSKATAEPLHNLGNLLIGAWSQGGRIFDGWVDELKVYQKALSHAEVQALYDASNAGVMAPGGQGTTVIAKGPLVGSWYKSHIEFQPSAIGDPLWIGSPPYLLACGASPWTGDYEILHTLLPSPGTLIATPPAAELQNYICCEELVGGTWLQSAPGFTANPLRFRLIVNGSLSVNRSANFRVTPPVSGGCVQGYTSYRAVAGAAPIHVGYTERSYP